MIDAMGYDSGRRRAASPWHPAVHHAVPQPQLPRSHDRGPRCHCTPRDPGVAGEVRFVDTLFGPPA